MPYLGEILALGAALTWSLSSFFFTEAGISLGAMQLNIIRLILAAFFLAAAIWIGGYEFVLSQRQVLILIASGFLGLVLGDTFLFKAFKEVGPRVGLLVMSFNPAFAAVLALILLGEKLNALSIAGMAIALGGISMVVLQKPGKFASKFKVTLAGVAFAFIAAFGQGSGLTLAKMADPGSEINSFVATFYRTIPSILILAPVSIYALTKNKTRSPLKIMREEKNVWLWVLLGSILGPFLGISFSFGAVIYTDQVGIAATLMATTPVMMLPLSKFVYKEKLSKMSIVGAFVALLGVALLFEDVNRKIIDLFNF